MATAPGFTEQVIHPLVGGLVSGVIGANTSSDSSASTAVPTRTKSKRKKFQKLTPEQQSAFLGMGTVSLQQYVPNPPNPRDNALAWSSVIHENLSHEGAASRVSDAYFTMREIYSEATPADPECAGMPAAMAVINIPSMETAFLASVVRGQHAGVTGPTRNLHNLLRSVVGGGKHRTDFACAEMHALNNLLWASQGVVPEGAAARIFGTPDGEDTGKNGAKKFMAPCQTSAGGVGCATVLTALGVDFLKTG